MRSLNIHNLSYRYPKASSLALKALSFSLEDSKVYGLLGQNGAGKTTLMRLLAHMIKNDFHSESLEQGCVIESNDWFGIQELGYLVEQPGTYKHLTAREYLDFFGKLYNFQGGKYLEEEVKVQELKRLVNHFEFDSMDQYCHKLSLGNKQKLQLLRCFWLSDGFLILDEPTANLDPVAQDKFWQEVQNSKAQGCCIVISSHQLNELIGKCDEHLVLHKGTLIEHLTQGELLQEQTLPESFIQEFEALKAKYGLPQVEIKESWGTWYQELIRGSDETL